MANGLIGSLSAGQTSIGQTVRRNQAIAGRLNDRNMSNVAALVRKQFRILNILEGSQDFFENAGRRQGVRGPVWGSDTSSAGHGTFTLLPSVARQPSDSGVRVITAYGAAEGNSHSRAE